MSPIPEPTAALSASGKQMALYFTDRSAALKLDQAKLLY